MLMTSTLTFQKPIKDGNVFKILKNKITVAVIANRTSCFTEREIGINNFYRISDRAKEKRNQNCKMCLDKENRVQR